MIPRGAETVVEVILNKPKTYSTVNLFEELKVLIAQQQFSRNAVRF